MKKTTLRPEVADSHSANDEYYTAARQGKPVLTVLDGPKFSGLDNQFVSVDYARATQIARQLQARVIAEVFSAFGQLIKRFVVFTAPGMILSVGKALKTRYQTRKAVTYLSNLAPEVLQDIGLTRGDISALAAGRIHSDDLNEIRRSRWPY